MLRPLERVFDGCPDQAGKVDLRFDRDRAARDLRVVAVPAQVAGLLDDGKAAAGRRVVAEDV